MKLLFERWRDNPQVQEATEKFSAAAGRFLSVRGSSETDDRIAARKYWSELSSMYWTVAVALIDAQTESVPEELVFDEQERLFLDLGVVDQELTPFHPEITRLLREAGAEEMLVFAGGIIPDRDVATLKQAGIDQIFLPGTNTGDIVKYLEQRLVRA